MPRFSTQPMAYTAAAAQDTHADIAVAFKNFANWSEPQAATRADGGAAESPARPGFFGLDREGVKLALIYLTGVKPSKAEVGRLFTAAERWGSQVQRRAPASGMDGTPQMKLMMTVEQFTAVVAPQRLQAEPEQQIRDLFGAFDTQQNLWLGVKDVQRAVGRVAPHLADRAPSLLAEADTDSNAKVGYREFRDIMLFPRPHAIRFARLHARHPPRQRLPTDAAPDA